MKYYKRQHALNGMPIYDYWRVNKHEWIQIQLRDNGEVYFLRSKRVYSVPIDAVECPEHEWKEGYDKFLQRVQFLH